MAETGEAVRLLAEQHAARSDVAGAQLAEIAWNERLLLLAVAGAYLWSALLWLELRRLSRRLHELSVRSRFDEVFRPLPEEPAPSGAFDDVKELSEGRRVPV